MKKRMSIREFQKRGYLFEVNRRFFHPLGLALAVSAPSPTSESRRLDCIIDARDGDDREGIIMGDWTQEQIDNANRIDQELTDGFDPARKAGLGWVTEPVPSALPEWARVALRGPEMSPHERGEHKGPPELCLACRADRVSAATARVSDANIVTEYFRAHHSPDRMKAIVNRAEAAPSPTEAAKAAWEEFDPGYSPYKGKADEMKTLFFAAYAAAEADLRKTRLDQLIELEGAEADPDVADTAWAIIEHHARHRTAG